MKYFNLSTVTATDEKRNELDPIACFIKETKTLRKDAAASGKDGLVNYLDSVLDFIQYAQADCERLNWLEDHKDLLTFHTKDLRQFIDKQMEKGE